VADEREKRTWRGTLLSWGVPESRQLLWGPKVVEKKRKRIAAGEKRKDPTRLLQEEDLICNSPQTTYEQKAGRLGKGGPRLRVPLPRSGNRVKSVQKVKPIEEKGSDGLL